MLKVMELSSIARGARSGWQSQLCLGLGLLVSGCADDGPAVLALPQSISIIKIEPPQHDQVTARISASATSDLPVAYSSLTPDVCSVDSSGTALAKTAGLCTVALTQSGNSQYAPAAQLTVDLRFEFGNALALSVKSSIGRYDQVRAVALGSGEQTVIFVSLTPQICSITPTTGSLLALEPGRCLIALETSGGTTQAVIEISEVTVSTLPGTPMGVTASAGSTAGSANLDIDAVDSGGSPIVAFRAASVPAGVDTVATQLPISVDCGVTCTGYAFQVTAINALGEGAASSPVDVTGNYDVLARFYEPDTQPNDSIFAGSFQFNFTKATVSELRGDLSESMTGGESGYPNDTMSWLTLTHQLSVVAELSDGKPSLLVTTFLLETTNTLALDAKYGGTDGWSPGSGRGLYYGYPGENPGNAYVRILVNTTDPTAPLTQAQLDRLAYADCAPGGMMGGTCMTGTSVSSYGMVGTMSGYPLQQTIVRRSSQTNASSPAD